MNECLRTLALLESELLERFPVVDAEPWDRMGLLVGDPEARVEKVAVALDPTVAAVEEASRFGAQALITHHPVFLDPPTSFGPPSPDFTSSAAAIWRAIEEGVALLNLHTALDVSHEAAALWPSRLALEFEAPLVTLAHDPSKGYGQLCRNAARLTLDDLAQRCRELTGRPARVWGDPNSRPERVVCATGSASNLLEPSIAHSIDCLICGELRYHDALDSLQRGLCLIELGHDASELPLCQILVSSLADIGFASDAIHLVDQSMNWSS